MSELMPSRSAVIALKEERKAMQEGYVFLDEKCLLLAGALLRELRAYEVLLGELFALQTQAASALRAALMRHGLQGLQCYPALVLSGDAVGIRHRPLLGVALQDAELAAAPQASAPPVDPSPEAEACRVAYGKMLERTVALAARSGNLERLYREYRRTARRARALQDVLLPEVEGTVRDFESRLEELEQDEASWARRAIRT
jgi:V/A-type H+-transporting ATPase subunit D